MQLSPILALVLALGMILVGNALEGGHISSLVQPTAAFIVFGGTIGATWLASPNAELKGMFKLLPRIIKKGGADRPALSKALRNVATVVRRDGMLAMERMLPTIEDEFLKQGLRGLIDGNAPEEVEKQLDMESMMIEEKGLASAKVFETAGGYAPTIGIIGAVLGLIHVMRSLDDPTKIGGGIAVAFVATVYGVGAANIVFLPLGNRMKKIVLEDSETRAMVLTGISLIGAGASTRRVGEVLAAFCEGEEPEEGSADKAAA